MSHIEGRKPSYAKSRNAFRGGEKKAVNIKPQVDDYFYFLFLENDEIDFLFDFCQEFGYSQVNLTCKDEDNLLLCINEVENAPQEYCFRVIQSDCYDESLIKEEWSSFRSEGTRKLGVIKITIQHVPGQGRTFLPGGVEIIA
mgnify:CR=1 FL=1